MNDFDDFIIEHFGVKGMKWGQRKTSGSRPGNRRKLPKALKKQMAISALKGGAAGAAVLGGAAITARLLMRNSGTPIVKVRANKDYIDVGSRVAKTIFENRMISAPPLMLTR